MQKKFLKKSFEKELKSKKFEKKSDFLLNFLEKIFSKVKIKNFFLNKVFASFFLASFLIDLFSKIVFEKFFRSGNFNPNEENWIVKNFFRFDYTKNSGISFSIFEGSPALTSILIFLLFLIFLFYVFRENFYKISPVGFGLILGGSFGNLIDRIFFNNGYVLDFLELKNFAVFNLADFFITIGFLIALKDFYFFEKGRESINFEKKEISSSKKFNQKKRKI